MAGARPIVVIGSSNVDFIMKMSRLPRPGETVSGAVYMQTWGGKGANQAVAAARAGGEVWFVTCLGDDDFADRMVENFARDGIHTDLVAREKGVASGTALILIEESGENSIAVAPGANDRLSAEHVRAAAPVLAHAGLVLVQYEIPEATLEAVLCVAEELRVPVLFNFAPARGIDTAWLAKVAYLVVNEQEAELLSGLAVRGESSARAAAAYLRSLGPGTVVITLGGAGVFADSGELSAFLPAFSVEAIDTTGAGDCFCGAFATAVVEGQSTAAALRFAQAAAALAVTRLGAQPSLPDRGAIDVFLAVRKEPP